MINKNLDNTLSLFKQTNASDNFIRGALFILGGVLLRTDDCRTPEIVEKNLQWLVPHKIDEITNDILGRLFELPIKFVIEEFFYKVNLPIPVRDIEFNNSIRHCYEASNHDLLPKIDIS